MKLNLYAFMNLALPVFLSVFSREAQAAGGLRKTRTGSVQDNSKYKGFYVGIPEKQIEGGEEEKIGYRSEVGMPVSVLKKWGVISHTTRDERIHHYFDTEGHYTYRYDVSEYHDYSLLIPVTYVRPDDERYSMKTAKESFSGAFFNHGIEKTLLKAVRFDVLAHGKNHTKAKAIIEKDYYADKSWMNHTSDCVATVDSISFLDIHCYLLILKKSYSDAEIAKTLIRNATVHLRENLGKGTEGDNTNPYSPHAEKVWEHTGVQVMKNASHQVLLPNRDPNKPNSIVIAEVDLGSELTHLGVQCLYYKGLFAEANRRISVAEHRALLNKKSADMYTCSASGHVLVNMQEYDKEHRKTEDANPYPVVAQRACEFYFSDRNPHADTEKPKRNEQPTSRHALRGAN